VTRRLPSLLLPALLFAFLACDAPAITPTSGTVLPVPEEQVPQAPPVAPRVQPVAVAPATAHPPSGARDGEWNGDEITWLDYDAGLARARAEGKPVCLVMHADWCPHCHTYARVFDDPRVVAQARNLVMVRVNVDHAPAVATRYALDGTYVPRTYFLRPDGTVLERVDARRPQYRYFFDENDPSSILGGMIAALAPG
jgi:thiol-disulfide isomerase/thioredoxin